MKARIRFVRGVWVSTAQSVGFRLASERKRRGLSQARLAAMSGVSKRTQICYEQGQTSPDSEYLSAIAGIGFDICLIVTGSAQSAVAP